MNKLYAAYCRTYQTAFKYATKVLDWSGPQVIRGAGSVKKLPGVLKSRDISNVMIVTDKVLHSLGLLDSLKAGLDEKGISYVIYDGTQPNPTIPNVEEARDLYINHNCQAVIAFGGGSPMDCAKVAAARVAAPGKTIPKMRGTLKVLAKLPDIYAIPTTAGTGSETTLAAVIVNPETHEKFAINDPCLRPKVAVLDPELTVGLPPHITSTTGMDALTHAVEAYIGRSNTPGTTAAAEKAVKMIFASLETAYNEPKNIQARDEMLNASFYAGVAFTQAYVGYVHAIAHNLGGFYNIPHGLANAIILPYVLRFYGEAIYEQLAKLADIAGLDTAGKSTDEKAIMFIDEICDMNIRMKIPSSFDCIKEEDISTIAERALIEANPLYPVPVLMDKEQCMQLIRSMMA
ncbi:MAG: iron-containing alcohol dehydrogenase [Clostridia bacterium]|nr:iron-containing alcohol dehydrogenase [Clostridia bacterium]